MSQPGENSHLGDPFFPTTLIIQALIDQGFDTASRALAELIDNSIQATATAVHVYCFSEMVQNNERRGERITKIAVLDNGIGMDETDLRKALQFGNGTRLGANKGLGKFGMGLPSASISQCDITEVFSWKNGVDSALKTTLSLPAVKAGTVNVPWPSKSKIDSDVEKFAKDNLQRTGSLIVWRDLARLVPVRFNALYLQLEHLAGRMYRKHIHSGTVSIFVHDVYNGEERAVKSVVPNDPLYLMHPSNTPWPYSDKALFKKYEDFPQPERTITYFDETAQLQKTGLVKVTISFVEPGVRSKHKQTTNSDAGKSPWGQHARKNVGYSICREGRELELETKFAKPSDPTERWWGVEIDFEPSLDRLFRVTSNKKALAIQDFPNFNWKDEAIPGESEATFYSRCDDEGDPRAKLMGLFNDIEQHLNAIRGLLSRDNMHTRTTAVQPLVRDTTEMVATEHAKAREALGFKGDTFGFPLPDEVEITKAAKDAGVMQEGIDHAVRVLEQKSRFSFEIGEMRESDSFFVVAPVMGHIQVTINSAHPFYEKVWTPLFETELEPDNLTSLQDRLVSVQEAFKMTLIAWSRLEDEAKGEADKMRSLRGDWGRMMKKFLTPIVYPNEQTRGEPPDDAIIYGPKN